MKEAKVFDLSQTGQNISFKSKLCRLFVLLFGYQGRIKGDTVIVNDAHSIGLKSDDVWK